MIRKLMYAGFMGARSGLTEEDISELIEATYAIGFQAKAVFS